MSLLFAFLIFGTTIPRLMDVRADGDEARPDRSWKFARVIVFDEPNESAAPMSYPCQ
jgi:hypothetical protein